MLTWDVIVIGGSIAGVGAAARIAADARVLVLEREPSVGYHTTGRSAAMLLDNSATP
jgi:D-arginine dehydrogenase